MGNGKQKLSLIFRLAFRPLYKTLPVDSNFAFLKRICATIIHILGIWFTGFSVSILMPMSVGGYIWGYEPNLLILLREVAMVIFSFIYLLYNFRMFVGLHRSFVDYHRLYNETQTPYYLNLYTIDYILLINSDFS